MSRAATLLGGLLLLGACTVDRGAHPAFGCASDSDCDAGQRCDRGFCIGDAGDGGVGGPDGCGAELACNGVDDDCDDQVDEFETSGCETELPGVCADGQWVCSGGAPTCGRAVFPSRETCNGRDDDCDGQTDELGPVACFMGGDGCTDADGDGEFECVGACRAGTATCTDGVLGPCEGAVVAAEEVCTTSGIGADENCDGDVDEGCSCTDDRSCYAGPEGTAGIGRCRAGLQTCTDGSLSETCEGQEVPRAESCENPGEDDDCDGEMDDVPGLGEPCLAESAMGECRFGALSCEGADGPAPVCQPSAPRENERCDGNDDDCDGRVDETFDLDSDPANCGACGVACGAEETCCAGACVDVRTSAAHCGACTSSGGASCGSTEVCCNGTCADAESCGSCSEDCDAMGRECCRGACVDTAVDEGHCGGCGVECAGGQVCCGGACVDPSDPATCGQACDSCEAGSELCCDGACVPVGDEYCNACNVACSIGTCCDAGCVDLDRDAANCGGCGVACPASQICSAGHCCPSGQRWCAEANGGAGGCVDTRTDEDHCGACGNRCGAVFPKCCGGTCSGALAC